MNRRRFFGSLAGLLGAGLLSRRTEDAPCKPTRGAASTNVVQMDGPVGVNSSTALYQTLDVNGPRLYTPIPRS